MSKKAEIIRKRVCLLRVVENRITINFFNECQLYEETYSVTAKGIKYYCWSNQDWHSDFRYCLIVNLEKFEDAKRDFEDKITKKINEDIDRFERFISSNNLRKENFISQLKEIELED